VIVVPALLVIVKGLCDLIGSSIGLLFRRLVRLRDLFLSGASASLIRLPPSSAPLPLYDVSELVREKTVALYWGVALILITQPGRPVGAVAA
jgi:hypothetical protein